MILNAKNENTNRDTHFGTNPDGTQRGERPAANHENRHPHAGVAPQDEFVLARRQLSVGRPDLSLRQPAVFLHLSKDEQAKRFRDRIDEPEKNWKFSASDIRERESWPLYMQAYEACISATSTAGAPWYVVPADDKEDSRVIVSQIVLAAFNELKMAYPKITTTRRQELKSIRNQL